MQTIRTAALLLSAALALAAPARALEVPVDIGVGPAAHWFTGPIGDDQLGHFGLKLSLAAVLDRALIQRNLDRVPPRYRKLAGSMDEVRYRPSLLIPDSLTISPKLWHTGMYGITWRPVALAMPLSRGASNLTLGAGVLLNYTFIHTDRTAELGFETMHFLRPGVDLTLRWEIPVLP
ncbi:MAG: hypothetical protein HY902_12455, partial [Deltaproteobacteria bacterium]|nr:hypothetical protein [Deltaproteobacteria bacterium]